MIILLLGYLLLWSHKQDQGFVILNGKIALLSLTIFVFSNALGLEPTKDLWGIYIYLKNVFCLRNSTFAESQIRKRNFDNFWLKKELVKLYKLKNKHNKSIFSCEVMLSRCMTFFDASYQSLSFQLIIPAMASTGKQT